MRISCWEFPMVSSPNRLMLDKGTKPLKILVIRKERPVKCLNFLTRKSVVIDCSVQTAEDSSPEQKWVSCYNKRSLFLLLVMNKSYYTVLFEKIQLTVQVRGWKLAEMLHDSVCFVNTSERIYFLVIHIKFIRCFSCSQYEE